MLSLPTGAALKTAALKTAALKTVALKTGTALTAAAAGLTLLGGTAQAAIPGPATALATTAVTQNVADHPRFDPRRRGFRAHFRTYAQCAYFANHDGRPRTNGWDCRHGRNGPFPWEYWY